MTTRLLISAAAIWGLLGIVTCCEAAPPRPLPPSAKLPPKLHRRAIADRNEQKQDRAEDRWDRAEDIRDARRFTGWADILEDIRDHAEDVRDHREDVRDRQVGSR